MAENLRITKYYDGTDIPIVYDYTTWANLTFGAYCRFSNYESYLFNWFAVNTVKLYPTGWHVPSDSEWTILSTYLGGESVAGGMIKETGTTHWRSPNTGATNESGFSAIAGGAREYDGRYYGIDGYYG